MAVRLLKKCGTAAPGCRTTGEGACATPTWDRRELAEEPRLDFFNGPAVPYCLELALGDKLLSDVQRIPHASLLRFQSADDQAHWRQWNTAELPCGVAAC